MTKIRFAAWSLLGGVFCFSSTLAWSNCARGFLSDEEFLRTIQLPAFEELSVDDIGLSSGDLFRTTELGESRDIVVRYESDGNDLRFEEFASQFVRSTGLSRTPVVVNRIFAADTVPFHSPWVSVAVFNPDLRNPVRVFGSGRVMRGLSDSQASRLADHWALTILLGIHDLHVNNWRIDSRDEIVGLDLAYRTSTFTQGEKCYPFGLRDPFHSSELMKDESKILLVQKISDETRKFLENLDKKWIRRVGERAGYPLTTREEKGILRRAKLLLEDIANARN